MLTKVTRLLRASAGAYITLTAGTASAVTTEYFDYSAFDAATGPMTIVGFDDRAAGSLLSGSEYSGVTIAARRIAVIDPQDFAPGLVVGGQNVNSQPQGISSSIFYNNGVLSFDNQVDEFTLTLAQPTQAAGLWLGNVGSSNNDPNTPTTIVFYGTSGQVIASEVFRQGHEGQIGSGANNRFYYGLTSDQLIASITVTNGAGDFDGIILDDVQWAAPIPEPQTYVLLAAGIAVLFGVRRAAAGG